MENKGIQKFEIGAQYRHNFKMTAGVVNGFKELSGDVNPVHIDKSYAVAKGFREPIVFGNALGFGLSYLIGMALPTEEVIILKQSIDYHLPVYLNDEIAIEAMVRQKVEAVNAVHMDLSFKNQNQVEVAKGKILIKCL